MKFMKDIKSDVLMYILLILSKIPAGPLTSFGKKLYWNSFNPLGATQFELKCQTTSIEEMFAYDEGSAVSPPICQYPGDKMLSVSF
jgi:hypothetical protein